MGIDPKEDRGRFHSHHNPVLYEWSLLRGLENEGGPVYAEDTEPRQRPVCSVRQCSEDCPQNEPTDARKSLDATLICKGG